MKTIKKNLINFTFAVHIACFIFPTIGQNRLEIVGRKSSTNICPSLPQWEVRSQQLCYYDEKLYHCLLTRSDHYLEVCTKPVDVQPGHYPRISEELDKLYSEQCPEDRYQPEGAQSNKFKKVTCDYMKAKCNGLGEDYCNHGNLTVDSQCKCDYLRGYIALEYLLDNPLNKSCYSKKDAGRGCIMYTCTDPDKELNPAYMCVKKCDPGFHRPPDQFDCIQNKSTSIPSSSPVPVTDNPATTRAKPVTTSSPATSYPPKEKHSVEEWQIAGIVTIIVIVIVIIVLFVYFLMEKYFKIHMRHSHVMQVEPSKDAVLTAEVPGFSLCKIEFNWTFIRKEDVNHEENDCEGNDHFCIQTEGCSSKLTISKVAVQDEADYVCSANLKCWSRIADKSSTTVIVKGGEIYTPVPTPMSSPELKHDKTQPNGNGAPKTPMDTDDEHDGKRKIIAGTYIENLHIKDGKHIAIGDGNTLIVKYEKKKKKSRKRKERKKDDDSDDSTSCDSDTPLMEETPKSATSFQRELKKLDTLAKTSVHKLTVVDVPRDGSCLYHAFIMSKSIHELTHDTPELRRQLVKFLESNPDTPNGLPYKDFLCLPLDSDHGALEPEDMAIERVKEEENQKELRWQRFLKKIQDGEWGGSLEIMGLAQLYNVPVTVLSVGQNGFRLLETKFNHTITTTLNPVIFIGHLKIHGKGVHFVAFKPLEEKAVEQPTSMQHGEEHRKVIDSSYPYRDDKVIVTHELDKRIGCIEYTTNKRTNGTGFRVGSKYVMTAFHVMQDILVPFWKEVYKRLDNTEKRGMDWALDVPMPGRWNLSKLLSSLDPSKQATLEKIGEEMIKDTCHIKFGFVGGDSETVLRFSCDVAFASPEHDVVILELADQPKTLPRPLIMKDTNIPNAKLHIIGHPKGIELQHDPGCKTIENQAELTELVNKGISFFTSQGYNSDQVMADYAPCVLSPDHILFHCSESTAHGASGSPLIVIKDIPKVTGMLLRGHPHLYYNYSKGEDRPDLLVESGISMEKIKSLLVEHSLHHLVDDLFSQDLLM
ncbi:uncharacterized protein LOC125649466 isoform X2 [Ostrea edulis]|uniref:uncharacterized protein LOC125649466 isoform X2 n=1 Tax=Ostrea edulis TaxID=37623 RepID=UPI0024AF3FA1|nr:uncharacterized protein LOC125649466 isoform X2 [Ostrea edulis]XP_056021085.1 uncharacterized protein LOC125649466 isoform X2 [Ostrea edulis]